VVSSPSVPSSDSFAYRHPGNWQRSRVAAETASWMGLQMSVWGVRRTEYEVDPEPYRCIGLKSLRIRVNWRWPEQWVMNVRSATNTWFNPQSSQLSIIRQKAHDKKCRSCDRLLNWFWRHVYCAEARTPPTSYSLLQILSPDNKLQLNFCIQSLAYTAFASRGVLCTSTAFLFTMMLTFIAIVKVFQDVLERGEKHINSNDVLFFSRNKQWTK